MFRAVGDWALSWWAMQPRLMLLLHVRQDGKTALDLAVERKRENVAALLRKVTRALAAALRRTLENARECSRAFWRV